MDTRRTEKGTASRTTASEGAPDSVHRLVVDHSERQSALVDAVRRSGWFDVQMDRLATGDYLVNGEALVERKTIRDFTASLLDGRLTMGRDARQGEVGLVIGDEYFAIREFRVE